jgi:hypothetical protein
MGNNALSTNTSGSENTAIGFGADVGANNLTNATAIGAGAIVADDSTIQLGNTAVTDVKTSGAITAGGKVIAGASSDASPSAVLEASSTTQGFLPPRMTSADRDAISNAVAGLVLWCTNCGPKGELNVYDGTEWTNMVGATVAAVPPLAIGQDYQGGKIAYILVSGDPGYNANIQHGLIAATVDQGTGIRWYNGSNTTTGATGTILGTGSDNTTAIIAAQGGTATSYAAGLARAYTGGGYNDWYLPSADELYKLYLNRVAIGGFTSNNYWTSTEDTFELAKIHDFWMGLSGLSGISDYKSANYYVRAVRSF